MLKPTRILLLLLCCLLAACSAPMAKHVSGDLAGEIVWQGRVVITGDTILLPGSRLVIRPGTEVVFAPPGDDERFIEHPNFPGSELIVSGATIIAEGTPDAPIRFRHRDIDAPAGSWGAINISESFDSSFAYCIFEQADSAVHIQDSRVYIEQNRFHNNLVAIRFHTSEILIENNLIDGNGTGIRFHFGQPVICKNDIVNNGKGFFVTSYPRNYLIENNAIHDNERNVVLGEEVPDDVVMPRNYWGTVDAEAIAGSFFDGRVESYLGSVVFQPLRDTPDPDSGPSWNR